MYQMKGPTNGLSIYKAHGILLGKILWLEPLSDPGGF